MKSVKKKKKNSIVEVEGNLHTFVGAVFWKMRG